MREGRETKTIGETNAAVAIPNARGCVVEETTEMNRDAKRDARGSRRDAHVNKKTAGRERMF